MAPNRAHHDSDKAAIDLNKPGTVVFYPRGLNIVWGADTRYWRLPEGREPAELIQVSWLEVTASTDQIVGGKKYKIYFELSLKSDAFGWNGCQVYLMAKIGRRGKYRWKKVSLKSQTGVPSFTVPTEDFVIEVPDNTEDRNLYFGLYEVWSGKWKGGLQIHKAVVEKV